MLSTDMQELANSLLVTIELIADLESKIAMTVTRVLHAEVVTEEKRNRNFPESLLK